MLALTTRSRSRAASVVAAPCAALTVWAIASTVLGADVAVSGPDDTVTTIGAGAVSMAAALAALAGWGVLAVLERRVARAREVWTVFAFLALALSLLGPVQQGATTSASIVLVTMHLAVAAVLIPLFRRTIASGPPAPGPP